MLLGIVFARRSTRGGKLMVMLKSMLALVLLTFAAWPAQADLDPALVREIKAWKPGDDPPTRLVKFPDGDVSHFPTCGTRVYGESIEDYLDAITDSRLLVAIMFDWRAQDDSILAAARQLLRTKGPAYVAAQLRQHRSAAQSSPDNGLWGGVLASLEQLLASPYVTMRVASIATDDMPAAQSQAVLNELGQALESGESWSLAYGRISQAHPDLRDDASCYRTLVRYAFHGVVSPLGYDLTTGRFIGELPAEHLAQLFHLGTGIHILAAPDGVYLYQVTDTFTGAS